FHSAVWRNIRLIRWTLNLRISANKSHFPDLAGLPRLIGRGLSRSIATRFRPLLGRVAGTCRAARNTPTRRSAVSGFGLVDGWLSPASCGATPGERPDLISCPLPCPSDRAGSCPGAMDIGAAATRRRRPSCAIGFACYIGFHAYLHS